MEYNVIEEHPGMLMFPILGALAMAALILFGGQWVAIAPLIAGFAVFIVLAVLFARDARPKEEVKE